MTRPHFTPFRQAQVASVFDAYPDNICQKLMLLRQLILDTANQLNITDLEETLKWGEPSYVTAKGSTLRIAWRKSRPTQYGLFFNCKTTLIATIREIYSDTFIFEGNRAIIFDINKPVSLPTSELSHCMSLSLRYHSIKHLPLLGL